MDIFEKYRPKTYLDLCTKEIYNKQFLAWMNSWTEYVFHKPLPSSLLQQRDSFIKNVQSKKPTALLPLGTDWSSDKIPNPPVLIVAGPSGCGKSSLISVCTKICGYNYRLLDSSTSESYDEMIRDFNNYMSNKSITFAKKSAPNAIHVSGLGSDSMSRAFLRFLIRQVKKSEIKRPVIITTDDPWTPLFVEIRQVSRVLVIAESKESEDVKKRLDHIFSQILRTKGQDFKIRRDLVADLSSRFKSDIRAALTNMDLSFQSELFSSDSKDQEDDYLSTLRLNFCLQNSGKTLKFNEAVAKLNHEFNDSIFRLHDDFLYQSSNEDKIEINAGIMDSISTVDSTRTLFQSQRSSFAAVVAGITFLHFIAQNNFTKNLKIASKNRSKVASSGFQSLQNRNLINSLPGFSSKVFNSKFLPEIHSLLASNLRSEFVEDTVRIAKMLGVEYTGNGYKPILTDISGVSEHALLHSSELKLRTKIGPEIKKTEKKTVKIKDIASPTKVNLVDAFRIGKTAPPPTPPSPGKIRTCRTCKYKSHDGASNPVLKNISLSKFL